MKQKLLNKYLPAGVAVIVLIGISLHDTKLDTMTKFAIALPAFIASLEVAHVMFLHGEAHTHVERVAFDKSASKATALTPKLPIRLQDGKFKLSHKVPKGHHPFDNYTLPVVS